MQACSVVIISHFSQAAPAAPLKGGFCRLGDGPSSVNLAGGKMPSMKPAPENPEFKRFTEALRSVLKVSKREIVQKMDTEKRKPAKTSVSRAEADEPKSVN